MQMNLSTNQYNRNQRKISNTTLYKRIVTLLLIVSVVSMTFSVPVEAEPIVNVIMKDKEVVFTQDMGFPFIDANNRTQVPFRLTLESFGAVVSWDGDKQMAYATLEDVTVYVPINEDYIFVNDVIVPNDTKAVIIDNRTYSPIRKILEAFGAEVDWDGETNSVIVDSKEYQAFSKEVIPRVAYQLTILTSFSDIKMTTTEEDWETFWYDEENSVRNFYSKMSKGKFEILGASETSGNVNDGIIEVEVDIPHPDFTYENTDYKNIDTYEMFKEIIIATDSYIDYSVYDKNEDTFIDSSELAITIIAAGNEESPYRDLNEKAVSGVQLNEADSVDIDSVGLYSYVLTGEIMAQDVNDTSMSTIGVVTHEFGHTLNLPDLYDVDYSSEGLSFHSLMASGSNSYSNSYDIGEYPAPLIAWSRIFTEMIIPERITEDGTYPLYGDDDRYNILKIETSDPKIYYLLENRQMTGYGRTFDYYMNHGGVAIWLVNEYIIDDKYPDNAIINDDDARGITLIEASGNDDLLKESLNYGIEKFDHYFENTAYTTPEGIAFIIEDMSQPVMNVTISLNQSIN